MINLVKNYLSKAFENTRLLLFLCLASVLILGLLIYKETLTYYFNGMDTFPLLLIGSIQSCKDIVKMFSSPLGGGFPFGSYYRPIVEIFYGLDHLLWGDNSFGYHLSNIFLHLGNTVLVFFFARFVFQDMKRKLFWSWLSAILFLLSPVNIDLVYSIERRQDMVAGLFLLLCFFALIMFQRGKKHARFWYLLSVSLGFLSIFSKESAFVLPILVAVYLFTYSSVKDYASKAKRAIKYSLPFFGIVAINIAIRFYLFSTLGVKTSREIYSYMFVASKSFFYLLDPINLLQMEGSWQTRIFAMIVLLITLVFAYILGRIGVSRILNLFCGEYRLFGFLTIWIIAFVLFYSISGRIMSYYMYIPNIAFVIIVVWILSSGVNKKLASSFLTTRLNQCSRIIGVIVPRMPIVLSICIVAYIITFSPVFTAYSAWGHSSEITRRTIQEVSAFSLRYRSVATVYLVNWPGFIKWYSKVPNEQATILSSYSMNAWAAWSNLRSYRNVEFIPLSYLVFITDPLEAEIDYTVEDDKIVTHVDNTKLQYPSLTFPYDRTLPIELKIEADGNSGTVTLNRKLEKNEWIFLYRHEGIIVIDSE